MGKKIYNLQIILYLIAVFLMGCGDKDDNPVGPLQVGIITAGEPAQNLQEFEIILDKLREKLHIPAYSAAIVKDKQIVWAKGFGYADVANNKLTTPTTSYHLASLTKTFASTIIMQLVEEGLLDLEAPGSNFGIELESPDTVRVKHLLTHTSGRYAWNSLCI